VRVITNNILYTISNVVMMSENGLVQFVYLTRGLRVTARIMILATRSHSVVVTLNLTDDETYITQK